MRRRRLSVCVGLAAAAALAMVAKASIVSAEEVGGRRVLDRVAVRFTAPETGGTSAPRFILQRELSFEARLEALAEVGYRPTQQQPFRAAHLRAALERHIAETILETLEVTPLPTAKEVSDRVLAANVALADRVGGMTALTSAAVAEGLDQSDVFRILERQARASLYLDRMVAPMLDPSDAELQALHQSGRTPFNSLTYDQVSDRLRRWLVSRRLREAALNYYEGARTRLHIHVLSG